MFASSEAHYTVIFNKALGQRGNKKRRNADEEEADGPVADRRCPKCGFERMSYAALQLRYIYGTK